MEENEELGIGLSDIMKLTGLLPIMIGTTFLLSPRTAIAVGPNLTEYGIFCKYVCGSFCNFYWIDTMVRSDLC